VGAPIVYARVDLIRDATGRLALMELEAIEPDLYLDLAPDGGDAFARAAMAAVYQNGSTACRQATVRGQRSAGRL